MSKNSLIPFLKDYLINFLTSPFLLDTNEVQNNYELRSLLRSFGAQIEVIAPESLRQMMKETAEAVSQIYEK